MERSTTTYKWTLGKRGHLMYSTRKHLIHYKGVNSKSLSWTTLKMWMQMKLTFSVYVYVWCVCINFELFIYVLFILLYIFLPFLPFILSATVFRCCWCGMEEGKKTLIKIKHMKSDWWESVQLFSLSFFWFIMLSSFSDDSRVGCDSMC